MADVIMPQMGESIAEGTVTKWLKNVGDRVERDEPLFEISTDKVDAEIPSPAAGVLREIRVAPGTTVPINTVVAVIAEAAPESVRPTVRMPGVPPPPPPPVGARAEPPAPPPPSVPPVVFQLEGETAPTPALAATQPPEGSPEASPEAPPNAPPSAEELRLGRSSPVVRRIAAEHHVDVAEIPGTGIGGRVTKQDILGHIGGAPKAPPVLVLPNETQPPIARVEPPLAPAEPPVTEPPVTEPPVTEPPLPKPPLAGARIEVVPMSPVRKRTAEQMLLSRQTSAQVTTVFEIDMTRVARLRDSHHASFEARGVRLTWTPFVLKAVADALQAFPVLNASIEGNSIVYRKDIHLGLAMALETGLIVPVIQHAEDKGVLGLGRAANDLEERAQRRKLEVEELQGATFTVTQPGVFGSLFGTPIINQPQVAILDVGAIEKRPVVRDDAIAIRTMAYFALTFDHRLVDGADADRFMAHVKTTLQEFDEAAL
jgi:pyruvate dehydrogenase E2 component (dihydrolipoamide acetyltransferase)